MKVTPDAFPTLYEALDMISHDGGGSAGHPSYRVADWPDGAIAEVESALCELTAEELRDFTTGEETQMLRMKNRNNALMNAGCLFDLFFDEGTPCGDPSACSTNACKWRREGILS